MNTPRILEQKLLILAMAAVSAGLIGAPTAGAAGTGAPVQSIPFSPADPGDPAATVPQGDPQLTLDQLKDAPTAANPAPSAGAASKGIASQELVSPAPLASAPVTAPLAPPPSAPAPLAPPPSPPPAQPIVGAPPIQAPAGPPAAATAAETAPLPPDAPGPSNATSWNPGTQAAPPPTLLDQTYAGPALAPELLPKRRHLWLYFGSDVGYATVTSRVSGEITRDGYQFGFRGLGSYYFDRPWVIDFGGGWERTQIQGTIDHNWLGYQEVTGLILRNGFVETSVRARLGDRFQLGPYLKMMFGTDLSFSPWFTPGYRSSPLVTGIQAFYEITPEDYSWATRLGVSAGTDIDVPFRQLFVAQFNLQIGLPLEPAPKRPPPPPRTLAPPPPPPVIVAPPPPPPVIVAPPPPAPTQPAQTHPASPADTVIVKAMEMSVEVTVGGNFVNFQTGQSRITPRFRQYLDALALALREMQGTWKTIEIQGHTDIRGGYQYNMDLSAARAQSAADALSDRGIPADQITTKHFGYTRPLDKHNNAHAWALNRRVEIRILGVNDSERLAAHLRDIPIAGPDGAPDPVRVSFDTQTPAPIRTAHKTHGRKARKKPARHASAKSSGGEAAGKAGALPTETKAEAALKAKPVKARRKASKKSPEDISPADAASAVKSSDL